LPTNRLQTHAVRDCILGYNHQCVPMTSDFWWNALPPEEVNAVKSAIQEHLDGKTDLWHMEHRYRDPMGEYVWVLEAGRVTDRDASGKGLRMVGITQRIQERKIAEDQIRENNIALTDAVRLKDVVLATMSHDLKNALTSASLAVELLKRKAPEHSSLTEILEVSITKAVKLLNDTHEFAKSQLKTPEKTNVNLGRVLEQIRFNFEIQTNQKNLSLIVEKQDDNIIFVDASALIRIIDNLVGNAIKFTEKGGLILRDTSTESMACIQIEDTGSGIPQDKIEEIFQPFIKLNRNKEGSGLGLSICNNLASSMGGSLKLEKTSPSGSLFAVYLPRINTES